MSNKERTVPTPAPRDLPSYRIMIDGSEISGELGVLSIVTYKEVNKVPWARIAIKDGDAATETFELSSSGDFAPGKEIEVLLGYHQEEETVFKGIIIKNGLKVRNGESSRLVIDAKDLAVKLTVNKKSAYYLDQTDSDIIDDLAKAAGMTAASDATEITHPKMVRYNATDWEFMVQRAEANGCVLFVSDGELAMKVPDPSTDAILSLNFGDTILDFEAEMDARDQWEESVGITWDVPNQEVLEEPGEDPGLAEHGDYSIDDLTAVLEAGPMEVRHTGNIVSDELKTWAAGKMIRSRLAKIRGRAKCVGFAGIVPGDVVDLTSLGDQFSGSAFVSGIRHDFTNNSWYTNVQFGLDPEYYYQKAHVKPEAAGGLVPSISGLQIGVVNALQDDPDGEHRIQVKVPMIGMDEDGIWARVSTLDAGDNRGTFFLPELLDEVIVGFLNDDPREAVVLGMLHSSDKPAPIEASDDNFEKGIVTKGESKLLFNDDLGTISIETANGNKILFTDDEGAIAVEDENGNKVDLTSDGIKMEDANGNIIEMGSGGITLESGADIILKASGDVNIEGVNIAAAAQAEFAAEGNSGAKLSTGAIAVIEGGIVQIN